MTYDSMENMLHNQDLVKTEIVPLNINRRLKILSYNTAFNTGGLLLLLSLVLGIYAGGFIITGNIAKSIVNAKSEINVFSSQIGGIAQAAELLVNICNNPGIAPFCKNNTYLKI